MPAGYNALAARPQNRLAYPGQDLVEAFTQGLGPMLYGAAKGTAATIAGMPGDIEQLARQLLLSGAAPDSYTAKNMATQALLPTSDRVRAMLPSLPGAGPQAQYSENMGATLGQNVVGNLVAPKALPAVIRAGQDLPVGASIKAVNKSAITREGNPIQGAVVLIGDKIFMGRTHGDAFNRAIYEGVIRKEGGKYIYPKDAEVNSDLFMTKDGQIIDRLQASKMFDIGASETAIEKGLMQNNPPKSMTVDSYIEQATALKKQREQSPYPQAEALRLAQQRAALPVEQGGLGLPATNTAMDRAKAMGGKDMVHFSRTGGDYATLDSGQYATAPFDAVGTHVGTPQAAMDRFRNTTATTDQIKGTTYPVTILGNRPLMNQNGMPWGEDDLSAFLRQQGGHNWSDIQGGKMTYQEMNAGLRKKLFEDQGYTSIPYYNEVEGKGSVSYIVPPENIRSRFAAFDPFRTTAATAAAAGLAPPDLLAAPLSVADQIDNINEVLKKKRKK